ncbi:MAG: MFS transporter [Candidatus Micrarchaeota archaeon]|nr:MFS transporter [Candidatus Micrarchaeota archaeon]MDE1824004.1 MFS transporter [Candidatus Micrarchaeota archaeon]MDE1849848.1 MFS transporter [Candidatus Micrarchaeota archaeon]
MENEEYDKAYARKALILFSGFIIIVMYIETMLVPSLPSIARQYHATSAQISLILSLYLISGIALNPIVGRLADIHGKKMMLKYILPVYTVAVAITGFAPNLPFILAARFIQGIGLTIFPLALSLVREQFPRDEIPRAQGILSAMFGAGSAIGLPIGAFISNTYGWQVTYHTALPLVFIFTILILLYTRESKYLRPKVNIDYIGAILLALSLALLVFVLSEGTTLGWTSAPILSMLALGLFFLAVFAKFDRKDKASVIDLPLLKKRNVLIANLIVFIVGLSFFLGYQTYAYEFESNAPLGYGFNIFQTGLALVPFAIMNIIMAPIVGKFVSRMGAKPFLFAGSLITVAGFLVSAYSTGPIALMAGAAIAGAGLSMLQVSLINVLIFSIDPRDMGLATSTNTVFRFIGSALGAPVAGVLIAEFASRAAFFYAFIIAVIGFALIFAISFASDEVLGKHRKRMEQFNI